jgi:hypothetical protein
MYERALTRVKTQDRATDDFSITIELHQRSTLDSYFFTLVLDVLTKHIQELAPRCMFFVDDVVLLGESNEKLNWRLETWRQALEVYGFCLSRTRQSICSVTSAKGEVVLPWR